MSNTVLNLISEAAATAGIIQPGQTAPTSVQTLGLSQFNDMVNNWSTFRLRLHYVPEATYAIGGGVGTYDIGPSASSFPSPTYTRPVFVESGVVIIGTSRRFPLNMLTRPQWNASPLRGLTSNDGPTDFFYDAAAPIGHFNMAPAPSASISMVLAQWNPLKNFASSDMALLIESYYPAEYVKALKIGLAMELSPAYRMNPAVQALFAEAIGVIQNANNDRLSGSVDYTKTMDIPTIGQGSRIGSMPGPPQA